MYNILIVDDEERIRDILKEYFDFEQFLFLIYLLNYQHPYLGFYTFCILKVNLLLFLFSNHKAYQFLLLHFR